MTTTTKAKYDERHGGPFDRGRADFWYDRPCAPHYFVGGTHTSDLVPEAKMTTSEIKAYLAGYAEAKADGGQKDWG